MIASMSVRYDLPRPGVGWELGETLPSSFLHDEIVTLLRAILAAWAAKHRPDALVVRDFAFRWDRDRPKHGVDPDVAVFAPRPPEDPTDLRSVCTWKEGHRPPLLAIEVVSDTEPRKDYTIAPDKYAASGAQELVVFDPKMAGPRAHGGPFRLQVWQRDESGALRRVYAGDGPSYCTALGAHLVVSVDGLTLRFADDAAGERLWLTSEEAARARIAELEAELARRGGSVE
jgi:Uma2 family endonuclease